MRQTDYSGHNPGMTLLARGWWARGRGGYATLAVIAAAAIAFFVCQWLLLLPPASASNPEAPLSVTPELVFSVGEIPDSIALGESVDLEFQISLRSGTGGHGGISVSFPDLTARGGNSSSYDSVQGTVTTISYTNGSSHVAYFDEGDQIFKGNDANRSSAKYLLVESDDDDWPSRSGSDYVLRTLKLRVTPKEPGAFLIYSRFWLCGSGYEDCDRRPRPEHSDQEDQQRWSVYEDTVEVSGPTSGPFSRNSAEDFDGLYEAENDDPEGIWSDGTTMWVADSSDSKIYAYNISNKARVSSKDFDTLDSAGNDSPEGIWSDGTTMWVADYSDDKIYAYNMSNKARVSSKDFDTLDSAGNDSPEGIWSDGTTMWVADYSDDKIYAYNMSNKARVSRKDFDTLEGAKNDHPRGIWSDGATMWVADSSDDKIYAYNISNKARVSSKDFDTLEGAKNDHPRGIWSDRTTMWVADSSDEKIYAYRAPEMAPAPTQNQNRAPSVVRGSPSSALVSLYTGDRQTFTARATDPDNNLKSYSWFVKDRSEESSPIWFGFLPTGSATDDFSHTFGTAGPYTVKATFTDKGGLSDSVSWTVVVRDPNRAPSVVRGSPYTESVSLETGDRQAFTANASDPDNNLQGYEWFVGDVFGDAFVWQTPPTGFASGSFSHTFSTEGTFVVEASFTDKGGLSDSVSWTVVVRDPNRSPSVSRVSPSSALVSLYTGDRQTFTARATDPDNNLKSYSWFVKDRSEESSPIWFGFLPTGSATDDFSHTFGTAGPYTVKATFTDKGGLSDSVSWTVVVRDPNRAPSVVRGSPYTESVSLETGDRQAFTANASDPDNNLQGYEWFVGDVFGDAFVWQTPPTGFASGSFSHTFSTEGTFVVEASFTDKGGLSDSVSWTVVVRDPNRSPSVSRVSPSSALVSLYTGDRQTFTARATDPDNNLKSYSWFVKDRSEESSPIWFGFLPTGSATDDFSHTFGTAGPYTVKATFTDKGGLSDSVSWTVVVRDPNRPSVDRVSPTQESLSLETGDRQSFTVRATDADNDLTKWKWVADWTGFGLAGHIEPEASLALTGDIPKTFSYTFDTTGTWTVTATFTDSRGEFGSAAWTVEVTDGPDLSIEVSVSGLAVVDQGVWVTTIVRNTGDERSAPFDLVFDLRSADENTGTSTEPHKLQSTFEVVAFLDSGDSSEQTRIVAMPNIASGEHRLCASLDFGGLAFDTDESNDTDCTLIFLLRHSSDLSKFDGGQSLVFPDLRIIPSLPPGFDFYFNHIFPLTAGVNKALAGACALGLLGHEGERFWVHVPEEIDVFAARRIIGASGMCHHSKRVDLYGRLAYELALRDQLEPESHMTSFDVLETGNEVVGATAEYLDLLNTGVEITYGGAGAALDLAGSDLLPHAHHFVQHAGPVLSSVKFGSVQADIILSAMADHGINVTDARDTLKGLSTLQMDSAWSEGIAVAGDDVDELTSDNFWVRYVAQTKQNSDEVLTSGVSLSFTVAGVIVKGGAIAGIKLNPAGLVVTATLLATLETLDHWKDLSLSLAAAQVYATMYDPDATGHDLEVQTYAKFLVYDHLYKSRSGNWMTWLSDHLKFDRGDRDLFLDDVSELRDEAFAEAAATVKLAEIEVEPSSLSVSAEETVCLKPTLITASGRRDSVRGDALSCGRVTIGGLTWTSSDTAVVSVSDRGRVQALSPGTATIIVTSGEISGTATVEVTPRVSCADGGAVADAANTGLVADCEALLAARDTLAGTASLNWSLDTPITGWDGVTVGGTPPRVTGLALVQKQLTGEIPSALASLSNLGSLRLDKNQLTGCIPPGLRDVASNDLAGLSLPFCDVLLSGLTVSPGVLAPAFTSYQTAYTAAVGPSPITVTPANAHNAAIAFLDENVVLIPDADGALAGHQVDLADGTTIINIKVTSLDGKASLTYAIEVTRSGLPAAPAIAGPIAAGPASLTVSWTGPAETGGTDVTSYDLRHIESDAPDKADANWTGRNNIWSSGALRYDLGGLTNGVSYDVLVRAVNAVGHGPWSPAATGTPRTTPGAPVIDSLIPGGGALNVGWSDPATDGGAEVTGYDLRFIRSDAPDKADANWTGRSGIWSSGPLRYDLGGLTDGVGYDVQVRAANAAGHGQWSGSITVTPHTMPTAPAIVSVDAGDGALIISWTEPADIGGLNIQGYDVRYIPAEENNPGATWTEEQDVWTLGSLEHTITGLTNGVRYDLELRAVTSAGDGPWSSAFSATPKTTPDVPIISLITPDGSTLTVAWDAPANTGGSAITSYDLRYIESGAIDKADANWTEVVPAWSTGPLSYAFGNLTGGTPYDVQVRAVNASGPGLWSATFAGTPVTIRASRSFSPAPVSAGGELEVTITAAGYGWLGAVTETLPPGFSYVSSSLEDSGVTDVGREVRFSLFGQTAFTYTVTAPSAEGTYSFSGVLRNSDREDVPVGGALTIAVAAGDPLIVRYDANNNGTIEKNEVIAAINDYLFGEGDEAISKSDVITLINLYLFG